MDVAGALVGGHTLPMRTSQSDPLPMASAPKGNLAPQPGPMVLLVDDEREALVTLEEVLVALGYRVTTALNGAEALAKAAAAQPDIVVTDLLMPVIDGIALAKALRSNPLTMHTRIVMCSGVEEGRVRRLFDRYDAFLPKPYALDELRIALGPPAG